MIFAGNTLLEQNDVAWLFVLIFAGNTLLERNNVVAGLFVLIFAENTLLERNNVFAGLFVLIFAGNTLLERNLLFSQRRGDHNKVEILRAAKTTALLSNVGRPSAKTVDGTAPTRSAFCKNVSLWNDYSRHFERIAPSF